jgi:hypothetical protein
MWEDSWGGGAVHPAWRKQRGPQSVYSRSQQRSHLLPFFRSTGRFKEVRDSPPGKLCASGIKRDCDRGRLELVQRIGQAKPMSKFDSSTLERKLFKVRGDVAFRRTITIEEQPHRRGSKFQVDVVDEKRDAAEFSSRGKNPVFPVSHNVAVQTIIPAKTLEEAVEVAENELRRGVDEEGFKTLALGDRFPG